MTKQELLSILKILSTHPNIKNQVGNLYNEVQNGRLLNTEQQKQIKYLYDNKDMKK